MPYPNYLPEPASGAVYARESNDEFETGGSIDYWLILRRHQGTCIVFAFAGALLGLLIASRKPRSIARAPPSRSLDSMTTF